MKQLKHASINYIVIDIVFLSLNLVLRVKT